MFASTVKGDGPPSAPVLVVRTDQDSKYFLSTTLKSWRKQYPVFEQKANPVFVTTENFFSIFRVTTFKLKNARNSN